MNYKNLIRGEIGIIDTNPFKMGLQTCLGTIIYGNKIVGVAHGLIPDVIKTQYQNPLLSTSKGIEELALLMKSKKDKNLRALLFGGKIDSSEIGIKNAEQARKILEKLKIPIKMDFAKDTYGDTEVMIYQDKFEVKAINFPSLFSKKFSELN